MGMQGAATEIGKTFDWEVTRRLAGYMTPYRRDIAIAMAAMIFSVAASVTGPPLIGYAVDEGIRTGDMRTVILGAVVFLVIQVVGYVGFRIQLRHMAMVGQSVIRELRDQLFAHVQRLSMSFFSTYETGRIIARVIGDVNVLREAISFAVIGVVRDLFTVLGMLIAMLLIDPALTLVAVGVVVSLSIIANFWRIYARQAYIRVRETNAAVNAELAENINGIRVVKAYNRERYNAERFRDGHNQDNLDSNMRATLVASMFFPSIDLVGGVAIGSLIYVGGLLVLDEQLSVFKLLTFVLYIEQFFFPIRLLAQRVNVFQRPWPPGTRFSGCWISRLKFRMPQTPNRLAASRGTFSSKM
ncbi:MAG: ABC transporter ATP-binding protein [Anaerolineae bacterium]|nr:ABC transporter ATP-binding protein [Anaerolineae bacterium]